MHRKITVGEKFNPVVKLFSKPKLVYLFSFSNDSFTHLYGSNQDVLITDVLLQISGATDFSSQRPIAPVEISMFFSLF